MFAELAGALSGSLLASKLAPDGGGSNQPLYYTPDFVTNMNKMLEESLGRALTSSQGYTQTAINTLGQGQQNANNTLQNYLKDALSQSNLLANKGLSQYQQLQGPYAKAGYDSLDAYKQTLGLSTPMGGSAAQIQAQQQAQKLAPLLQKLGGNYSAPTAPTAASLTQLPNMDAIKSSIDSNRINSALSGLFGNLRVNPNGQGRGMWNYAGNDISGLEKGKYYTTDQVYGNTDAQNWARNQLAQSQYNASANTINAQNNAAQQKYNTANTAYQGQLENYNQANSMINNLDPSQRQAIAYQLRSLL